MTVSPEYRVKVSPTSAEPDSSTFLTVMWSSTLSLPVIFSLIIVAEELPLTVLMGIFALSRTLSGLALVTFPLREGSGLARLFAEAAERKGVRMALLALGALLLTLLCLKGAWPAAPAAAGVFLVWRRMCVRDFGGLSGDLAGWFVQTAELWMLAAVILRQLIN